VEIIGGFDVHRKQITFDYVEMDTGEVHRGEIRPATREHLSGWLSRFEGKQAAFALEATTGWRFVVEELRRFSSSRHAVRFAGLDVTVSQSDDKRSSGKLSRQGSPVLRWAVFEAAQVARRGGSPEHDYYTETRDRLGPNRACLAVARKLIRQAHHTIKELGDEALQAPSELRAA
jgi:hypothetical protein